MKIYDYYDPELKIGSIQNIKGVIFVVGGITILSMLAMSTVMLIVFSIL